MSLLKGSRRRSAAGVLIVLASIAAGCTSTRDPAKGAVIERGIASWYGGEFHGRTTASGGRYDMHRLTAAHKTLPFGTLVEVRNLDNGRTVRVRITDRGPFVRGRIIDLSRAAARRLDMIGPGTARVELVLVAPASPAPVSEAHAPLPTGTWTVQVGAFTERERAQSLRDLLARHYPATEVRSEGPWHRVQVGRFEKKKKAEGLRRDLEDLGWQALVVPLAD